MTTAEAIEQIKIKIRQSGVPNSIEVWDESGSVMLGFGDFVAEISRDEVENFQSEVDLREADEASN